MVSDTIITTLVIGAILLIGVLYIWQTKRQKLHLTSFKGKHVVITGGSSGIGFALAKRCAAEGAFLTLIARTPAKLEAARDAICSTLGLPLNSILIKAADASDGQAISMAIKESFEWKPIDILICCAGIASSGRMGEAKVDVLEMINRVNLMGCVLPVHTALPMMKSRSLTNPSSIVIISSLASLVFVYASNMYTPTKYALRGFAELLRFELLPWNIKVNLVCPGFTETPMLDEVDKQEANLRFANKLGFYNRRFAESPDEVARKTIDGIRKGEFLVTTTVIAYMIRTLARGFIPPDSFISFMIELLLLIPIKILSFFYLQYIKGVILRGESVKASKE